jgi:hypothetical protein
MAKWLRKTRTALKFFSEGNFAKIWFKILQNIFGKKYYRDSEFRILVDKTEFKPKLERALEFLRNELKGANNLGDYLEFGVSHGSSLLYVYQTLQKFKFAEVRLFGFDSFEGLPEEATFDDDGTWSPGAYYAKEKNVRKFLSKEGVNWEKVKLIKGWFSDTLKPSFIKENRIEKASVIMIDCDMYISAKEALDFCVPLIKDKTIIIFDDWNSSNLADRNLGEKKAFEEFMNENPQFEFIDFDKYSYNGYQSGEIKLVSLKEMYQESAFVEPKRKHAVQKSYLQR